MIHNVQETARAEGLAEGRSEGLEQGRSEGLELGRQEGLREGLREGIQEGKREERQENIKLFIESFQELKVSKEDAQSKLEVKFSLSQEEAEEYISKYWQ